VSCPNFLSRESAAGVMKVDLRKVKIFKIRNRKGYACICYNNLTEGKTVYQAYRRMVKALKRSGMLLDEIDAKRAQRFIK